MGPAGVKAEFSAEGGNSVEFSHLEGACQVALFGPVEVEDVVLGPDQAPTRITVLLYDDDGNNPGVAIFDRLGSREPAKPTGDYEKESVTIHFDIDLFDAYMDILRQEETVYLKIGWTQQGKVQTVAQASIDTKEEIIGEFFEKLPRAS